VISHRQCARTTAAEGRTRQDNLFVASIIR